MIGLVEAVSTSIFAHVSPRARSWARAISSTKQIAYLAVILGLAAAGTVTLPVWARMDAPEEPKLHNLKTDPSVWTGDFDGMVERRLVRVAVPYCRTLFYLDRGQERGLTAHTVRKFEEYINNKYRKDLKKRPITVLLIPTTRDRLIPALLDGRATFTSTTSLVSWRSRPSA